MRSHSTKKYRCLEIRSAVIQAIRDFFTGNHYLEVDTPVRCPSAIPEAHTDPVNSGNFFLQASPELCMKRLLSEGYDKIFQICKCFRKNERGVHHLPELTLLEWYAKDDTYLDLMDQCEQLIQFIAAKLNVEHQIRYQGQQIRLDAPWKKLTVDKAFDRYADKSLNAALEESCFDEILSLQIEPHLGLTEPVFLCDYPSGLASLAKLKPDNHRVAQRFEFYMAGIELANGFTELTDPVEQLNRFVMENRIRVSEKRAPIPIPEKFLRDLQHMPDAAGIAMGIDRLVMIFSNAASIDEVITFTPETL